MRANVGIISALTGSDGITSVRPNPAEPARPSESGRTQIGDGRPNPAELRFGTAVRIRPNSDLGRPSESGRTQIWDGRLNPAELRFGTAARIRPNSDWGRPPESGRKIHKTKPKSELWSNFIRCGFKTEFLTQILCMRQPCLPYCCAQVFWHKESSVSRDSNRLPGTLDMEAAL